MEWEGRCPLLISARVCFSRPLSPVNGRCIAVVLTLSVMPALARLAAQLPPAGAVLERAAATGLLVVVAMAPAPETHR